MVENYLLAKLLSSWRFNHHLQEKIGSSIAAVPGRYSKFPSYSENPYNQKLTSAASLKKRNDLPYTIFISSRFRSGSTLLWTIFHQLGLFTSYYEPLNERRWFQNLDDDNAVDPTHIGATDYRTNYEGLGELSEFYSLEWNNSRLFMQDDSIDLNLRTYVDILIKRAKLVPVLQFNRVDFRLPWLKTNYPNAKILHLLRNPREQWMSTLYGQTVPSSITLGEFERYDRFYLIPWIKDLRTVFSCLDLPENTSPYAAHYILWRLSQIFGEHYGDITVRYEEVMSNPLPVLKTCLEQLGISEIPKENWARISNTIRAPGKPRWEFFASKDWFLEQEELCEFYLRESLEINRQ